MKLVSCFEIHFNYVLEGHLTMKFEEIINIHSGKINNSEFNILTYIVNNKDDVIGMKSHDLANITFSSTAGLTRLAKKLGFSGFSELRFFLSQEVKTTKQKKHNYNHLLLDDVNQTLKTLTQADLNPIFLKIRSAKTIYVFGTDWGEKRAAELLSRNFLAFDLDFIIIPSITELNWKLSSITSNDLLILISYSGLNIELNKILHQMKLQEVQTLSITPLTHNPLSAKSTYNLYYQSTKLDILSGDNLEFNYYSTLDLTIDLFFRLYLEKYY